MITRPAHQAGNLAKSITTAGGNPFLFPTLSILPSELSPQEQDTLQQLHTFDIIIFISPNAVEHGLNHLILLPDKTLLATIGQGSAKALYNKLGKQPDISPKENFNSEGLLATKEMQEVQNKRILIIRGNSGREHLKNTLEQRGAHVEYLAVYLRAKPVAKTDELERYLQNKQIAVIVITSVESLKNLLEMTPKQARPQLVQVPLLLINQRLVNIAKEAGFDNSFFISSESSDEAIIKTLKENHLLSAMHG